MDSVQLYQGSYCGLWIASYVAGLLLTSGGCGDQASPALCRMWRPVTNTRLFNFSNSNMKWTLQFSCSNKLRRVIFIANSCSFKPGWQKSNKGRDYLKIKSCKALHSKVLYINFHLSSVYILCSKVFLLGWSITNLMSFRQVTACCDPPESKEKGIKDWITAYFTLTWRYPWLWLLSWTLRAIVPA